jgi:phosphoenolpyruvate-protein phosphotransferase (PTS system enzyme I)
MSHATARFQGIGAGPGFAVGYVWVVDQTARSVPVRTLPESQLESEVERFNEAIDASVTALDALLRRAEEQGSEGVAILKAHRLILQDELLVEGVRLLIRQARVNAEAALERTLVTLEEAFAALKDEYFKERSTDLRYVVSGVLAHLLGDNGAPLGATPAGAIIVAHDLSPAQTLEMTARHLGGFVTEVGGKASHTAIMARAMEIPAVVGAAGVLAHAANGQWVAVDGSSGEVVLNPSEETLERFREERRRYRARETALLANRDLVSRTRDGVRIELYGNIEFRGEIESLRVHGGEGIGLYRTEYLFFRDPELPDEEMQFDEYRRILEEIAPLPATLRTLDVGADKMGVWLGSAARIENPALGLRGVRLSLSWQGLLRTQLRALLRASSHGRLRLLVPFVTGVRDLRQVRALVEEVRLELLEEGHTLAEHIPLGIMIEVPSAAIIADLLAPEVDFLSLGTNDLVQYTLAVDRNNQSVAPFYRPLHPAVLRLIRSTAEAGRVAGVSVSICGEIAGEPYIAPVLIGSGLRAFSMNPISIPHVKDVIVRSDAAACRALVDELATLSTADEVEGRVREFHAALMED